MCRFTRQEFIQGCKAMNVDSIKVRFLRECMHRVLQGGCAKCTQKKITPS